MIRKTTEMLKEIIQWSLENRGRSRKIWRDTIEEDTKYGNNTREIKIQRWEGEGENFTSITTDLEKINE